MLVFFFSMISFLFLNYGKDMLIKNLNKLILVVLFLASSLISLNSLAQTSYKYNWYAYQSVTTLINSGEASSVGEALNAIRATGADWRDQEIQENIWDAGNGTTTLYSFRNFIGWEWMITSGPNVGQYIRTDNIADTCAGALANINPGNWVLINIEPHPNGYNFYTCWGENPDWPNNGYDRYIGPAVTPYCENPSSLGGPGHWAYNSRFPDSPTPQQDYWGRNVPAGMCFSSFNGRIVANFETEIIDNCEIKQPEANNCSQAGPQGVGNPINISHQAKTHFENVYNGNQKPVSFNFSLTYSANTGDFLLLSENLAWLHNYDKFLIIKSTGTNAYKVKAKRNAYTAYNYNVGSSITKQVYVQDILSKVLSGSTLVGWKLYNHLDDSNEYYDLNGKLTSITDRNNNTLNMIYADGTSGANGGYLLDSNYTYTSNLIPAGLLIRVEDTFGRQLKLDYKDNANYDMVRITTPDNQVYKFTYNNDLMLTSIIYPDNTTKQFVYGETANTGGVSQPLLMTGIIDQRNNRIGTYKYTNKGKAISTEGYNGVNKYEVSFDSNGNAIVTDPSGNTETRSIASHNGLLKSGSTVKPCGTPGCSGTVSNSVVRDPYKGVITQITDFNGNITKQSFDGRNLMTQKQEAYGTANLRTTYFTYHNDYRLIATINEPSPNGSTNKLTTNTYDTYGNLTKKKITVYSYSSLIREWNYTYDSQGKILTSVDPRNKTTTYSYYSSSDSDINKRNQLYTITNPLNQVITFNSYDSNGNLTQYTDSNGLITKLEYDVLGRLTSKIIGYSQSNPETISYQYDNSGNLTKIINPDSSYLEYVYDNANRLIQVNDTSGNKIIYTLNNNGDIVNEEVKDNNNTLIRSITRTYDSLKRLQSETTGYTGETTTLGYDNNDNQTKVTNPLNKVTDFEYDQLNRLTKILDAQSPTRGVSEYGYNRSNYNTSVKNKNGKTTTYTYNGLGDRLTQVSPDTGTTTFTYDSAGNVLTKVDSRSVTATYSYDDLGRVSSIVFTKSGQTTETHSFTYDDTTSGNYGIGKLTGFTDGVSTTSFKYDLKGRLIEKQQVVNGLTQTINYGYDSYGRLNSITYPSGVVANYGYNSNGEVNAVSYVPVGGSNTGILSGVTYEPFLNQANYWLWSNGYKQYYDFDLTGRNFKYELTNSSDVSLLGKDYYFDLNSNITTINDIINNTLNRTVTYDNIDRITSSVSNSITQSFTYDLNSNRLSKNDNGTNVTYTISSTNNRLNSVGGTSYTYDNAGNPTAIGSTTFGYNLANRLVSVNSGNLANYYHNTLGQRVRKLVSSVNTYFMYSEDGKLLGEYDNSGNLIREYIYLGDKIVAVVKGTTGNELYYVIPDHLNTPRKVINSSNGNIIWSWESKPFGDDLPNEDVDNDSNLFTMPIRFPGQYYDSEVGYNYNYFRTYNSDTGRYLQSDPIGLEGGLNTYGYVYQNSLKYVDPLGLDVTVCFYPDAAADYGHVGYGVNSNTTYGFTRENGGWAGDTEGAIKPDNEHYSHNKRQCITIKTNEKQDSCILNEQENRTRWPGNYKLHRRQCTSYVQDALSTCNVYNDTNKYDPRPENFYRRLKNEYKK